MVVVVIVVVVVVVVVLLLLKGRTQDSVNQTNTKTVSKAKLGKGVVNGAHAGFPERLDTAMNCAELN